MSLFDIQDNFQLCNKLFSRLAEFDNRIDVDSCGELERVITLVWHSAGLLGNGGFHHLFEGNFNGDPGFVYTAAAYDRIGVSSAYQAFQDAFRQFPGDRLPDDIEERLAIYESLPKQTWDVIERRYYEAGKDTTACLARFIRENREGYERLMAEKAAKQASKRRGDTFISRLFGGVRRS